MVGGDCHCNLAIAIGLMVRIEAVERLPADQLVGTRIGGDEIENASLEQASAESGVQMGDVVADQSSAGIPDTGMTKVFGAPEVISADQQRLLTMAQKPAEVIDI